MWSPTHVQIVVQRARNVIAKGRNGTSDAYVIIQNGKEKFQTSVKEQTTDPIWHEECDLEIENKETDVIKLIVFHRNLFGLADEFLGQTLVPLKDFDIYERPKSRWYELEGRSQKKTTKFRGEIEVRLTFIVKNNFVTNKYKKRHSLVHHSLLDIRGALKGSSSDDRKNHFDKHETKGRKLSMADNVNKMPKVATRSISFKLDAFNSRRKSLVDKFLKKHESLDKTQEEYKVEEEESLGDSSGFNSDFTGHSERSNDVIKEEMSQSQEEMRNILKNSNENKIVIEIKNNVNLINENNSFDSNVDKINEVNHHNQCNNDEIVINGSHIVVDDNCINSKSQTKNISSESKSNPWKPLKGTLKKAFSSNNINILSSNYSKPVSKSGIKGRDRSLTLVSHHSSLSSQSDGHQNNIIDKSINNNNNNNKTMSSSVTTVENNDIPLRQTYYNNNREKLIAALQKIDRRHTIDINDVLPKPSTVSLDKRVTQASPDSMYSSFESLINRKQTKTDYHQKYDNLNKEELIQLIESQQLTILGLNEQINDLEQYIDNLLVRVIETSPRILQNSYKLKTIFKI